jgi:hypothetical protein
MINPFDLFIVYISWGTGGKLRPVLVLSKGETTVDVYPITTQYVNKSKAIRENYFKIIEWNEAGLDQESYIDTGTILSLPLIAFEKKAPIGHLTKKDKIGLFEFLNK